MLFVRRVLYFLLGFMLVATCALYQDAHATATATYQASVAVGDTNHYCMNGGAVSTSPIASLVSSLQACNTNWVSLFQASPNMTFGALNYSADGTTASYSYGGCAAAHPTQCSNGTETFSLSCPNGGSLSGAFPDWCLVNGQPPPTGATPQKCKAAQASYAGMTPFAIVEGTTPSAAPSPGGSIMDTESGNEYGCNLVVGSVQVSSGGQWTAWATLDGTVNQNAQSQSSANTSLPSNAPACSSSGDVCLAPGSGVGNANTPDPQQTATVDGQSLSIPGSIPDNSCVTAGSGMLCASDAIQPNNGQTPPAPATPTDVISSSSTTGTSNYNYYDSTTVEGSSNMGNGKPVTTTTTTTTCPAGGTCTTSTAKSATTTTYPTPAFPAVTSAQESVAGAASAIQSSPLVTAASSAIAQSVPAGACPAWSWSSTFLHQTFSFQSICTMATTYMSTLQVVFAAGWVILGAIIILSA